MLKEFEGELSCKQFFPRYSNKLEIMRISKVLDRLDPKNGRDEKIEISKNEKKRNDLKNKVHKEDEDVELYSKFFEHFKAKRTEEWHEICKLVQYRYADKIKSLYA